MSCLWLKDIRLGQTETVGGKASSLGEMYNHLVSQGIRVPNGFVLTVEVYHEFLKFNHLEATIAEKLSQIDYKDLVSLKRGGLAIRNLILNAEFPTHIRETIIEKYRLLSGQYFDSNGIAQKITDVAVRSSSTAEDLKDSSFAGQYDTFLNVRGDSQVLESVKACYASLFNNRAISYRFDIGYVGDASQANETTGFTESLKDWARGGSISPEQVNNLSISVVIQKMVRSDCGKSGVMFTIDTESGFDQVIVINSAYGLCELVVQGSAIKPDEHIINKERLRAGFPAIIDKKLGLKTKKMVYSDNPSEKVRVIPVGQDRQKQFCLSDENVLELGQWALLVEDHYNQHYGQRQAYDIEFAYDGLERQMYLVQVRPETIHSGREKSRKFIEYKMGAMSTEATSTEIISTEDGSGEISMGLGADADGDNLEKMDNLDKMNNLEKVENFEEFRVLTGISVGNQINHGRVRVIMSLDDRGDNQEIHFEDGDILVTSSTDPDWEPLMKRAGGIVTDFGGRTSHASIVSRELGVTCVVGCGQATQVLKDGQIVTVSCAEGDVGYVYDGLIPHQVIVTDLDNLPKPPIKLMMNLASPEMAFRYAWLPHSGVGLAREEFIINNFIKVHPCFLIDYDRDLGFAGTTCLAPAGKDLGFAGTTCLAPAGKDRTVSRQHSCCLGFAGTTSRAPAGKDQPYGLRKANCEAVATLSESTLSDKLHTLGLTSHDLNHWKDQVTELIQGYASGRDYYVSKLAFGIARIATAVYPEPTIVRFSDFKSNEYANLLGGQLYEPHEENPMLGWRGCSRYYSANFEEAFGMECQAIKRVRETMGLDNVIVMLPFCRTIEECQKVQGVMAKYGLVRKVNGLEVYLMCEIPANVILAEEFCQLVDGFSIGSNDLTQLTLGVDRDSDILANMFNENNLAVKKMISQAIKVCHEQGVKIGICGQAPSDHPDFAQFLISEGIDTISLVPDSIIPTIKRLNCKIFD